MYFLRKFLLGCTQLSPLLAQFPSRFNLLDKAMERVKLFAKEFPPGTLLTLPTSTKPALRSTQTILANSDQITKTPAVSAPSASSILSVIGGRPLVRLTSSTELVDDNVPPFLTFMDLRFLHQRLVVANRLNDVKYLTWVLKSYSGTLKMRREQTLQQGVARPSLD